VKEEIQNYRKGIQFLNLGMLMGQISDYQQMFER